jgi:hypothetical protein
VQKMTDHDDETIAFPTFSKLYEPPERHLLAESQEQVRRLRRVIELMLAVAEEDGKISLEEMRQTVRVGYARGDELLS